MRSEELADAVELIYTELDRILGRLERFAESIELSARVMATSPSLAAARIVATRDDESPSLAAARIVATSDDERRGEGRMGAPSKTTELPGVLLSSVARRYSGATPSRVLEGPIVEFLLKSKNPRSLDEIQAEIVGTLSLRKPDLTKRNGQPIIRAQISTALTRLRRGRIVFSPTRAHWAILRGSTKAARQLVKESRTNASE